MEIARLITRHHTINSVSTAPSHFLRSLHPSHQSKQANTQISVVMDKFESQFSDLDVQTSYMESTMSDTTALTTPQDQVDTLISQVADENGLEISQKVGEGKVPSATPVPSVAVQEREGALEEDGKLAERLRALRVSEKRRSVEARELLRYCQSGRKLLIMHSLRYKVEHNEGDEIASEGRLVLGKHF